LYIDSHAHLEGAKFDSDRAAVLDRARQAGVEQILAIGSGPGSWSGTLALAEAHPWIHSALGIDPHMAKSATDSEFDKLQKLLEHRKVIACGEIGLDYFHDLSPRDVQRGVFLRQLEMARAARVPVVIHCRPSAGSENAWDDAFRILSDHSSPPDCRGIIHCFGGEWSHASAAIELGFYISFAGTITFPRSEGIREAAGQVPIDRILIETDCPYLAPVPHRGCRNEPVLAVAVAEAVGYVRGLSKEEIGLKTSRNFHALFPQTAV
jgi:TatD DNase family protein